MTKLTRGPPARYVVGQWKPAVFTYADGFQQGFLSILDKLPTAAQKDSAVFSSGCFRHCVTDRRRGPPAPLHPPSGLQAAPSSGPQADLKRTP